MSKSKRLANPDSFDPEVLTPVYCHQIILAAWLYYHGGKEQLQSPLSDDEYDQKVKYVVANWHAVPIGFKARISREQLQGSSTLFDLKFKVMERHEARAWAREGR